MQCPLYLLQCTHPFSTFIKSFISFDYFLLKVFGRDSLEKPLIPKQASFPITFGGVRFILTSTITHVAHLGNWAFVTSIIVVRFMINQCPFLLEALTWVNNTFPFQQNLKVACYLLPPLARVCLPPFEQLIKQQMVQLQDFISERLHHHTLSNTFANGTFQAHNARILSCSNLGVGTWLTTQPVFLAFNYLPQFCTQHFICDSNYLIPQL